MINRAQSIFYRRKDAASTRRTTLIEWRLLLVTPLPLCPLTSKQASTRPVGQSSFFPQPSWEQNKRGVVDKCDSIKTVIRQHTCQFCPPINVLSAVPSTTFNLSVQEPKQATSSRFSKLRRVLTISETHHLTPGSCQPTTLRAEREPILRSSALGVFIVVGDFQEFFTAIPGRYCTGEC